MLAYAWKIIKLGKMWRMEAPTHEVSEKKYVIRN